MSAKRCQGKWKMELFLNLKDGALRMSELERRIPEANPRMLARRLRSMEKDGIVHREVYAEVPPRVEYSLTERGKAMVSISEEYYPDSQTLRLWGKWMIELLAHLKDGTLRMSELEHRIPEANPRVLARQLRNLEKADLVQRKVYAEVPPRVEYSLTERGKAIVKLFKVVGQLAAEDRETSKSGAHLLEHRMDGSDQLRLHK